MINRESISTFSLQYAEVHEPAHEILVFRIYAAIFPDPLFI